MERPDTRAMPQDLELATSRLRLRPFGEDDFEAFYTSCVCDPP
jgi:hypothetical protein